MTGYFRKKWVRVLLGLAMALAGAWAARGAWDTYGVMKMTWNMTTVCAGRMLIDVPEQAQLEFYGQWIDGLDIDAHAESTDDFDRRVAAREAEIRATPDRLGGNRNMESVRDLDTASGLRGRMFVHTRNVVEGTAGSDREDLEHFHYEGVALEAHVHGDGISIDVTAKDYDPDYVEDLPKLVSQLVPNPGNRIPAEAGFCLDQAWVRDPLTAKQGERITIAVKLPSHPDIGINFDSIAGTKPAPQGLIERNAAARARLPAVLNLRVIRLRAAPRTIGGLTGDELVQEVMEATPAIVHGFQWEVLGKEDDVLVPALTLTMATGRGEAGPVWPSLSEPAALVLWDKIASSIRVRPVAAPRTRADAATAAPLGTVVAAGAACPRSGWWACRALGDGVEVQGGRRQYLRQGQRMPPAPPPPQAGLWARLRGRQAPLRAREAAVWTLVEVADDARA